MKYWRSKSYRAAARRNGIEAYYRKKAASEQIPENDNVINPKIKHDCKIIIKLRGQPQMTLTTDRMPWGGWSVSPTKVGQKLQQVLLGYSAT